jgi:hypothetical protein
MRCSLSSLPHLNLTIIFLSLALSLPRYFAIPSVIHLSYSLLYLDSLPSLLLVSMFVPFTHLPSALKLSTCSLVYLFFWYYFSLSFSSLFFFFSPQNSINILHSSLPSILSSNWRLEAIPFFFLNIIKDQEN